MKLLISHFDCVWKLEYCWYSSVEEVLATYEEDARVNAAEMAGKLGAAGYVVDRLRAT